MTAKRWGYKFPDVATWKINLENAAYHCGPFSRFGKTKMFQWMHDTWISYIRKPTSHTPSRAARVVEFL